MSLKEGTPKTHSSNARYLDKTAQRALAFVYSVTSISKCKPRFQLLCYILRPHLQVNIFTLTLFQTKIREPWALKRTMLEENVMQEVTER